MLFINLFQNQIISMKTIVDLDTEEVLLLELENSFVISNEPIRCNHLVIVFCNSGEVSVEINYTLHQLSKNMILTISPLDIVTLKERSDDFKCTTLILNSSLFPIIFAEMDVSRYGFIKHNPAIRLENEYILFVQQTLNLLRSVRELVSEEYFKKIAVKHVAAFYYVIKHHYSTQSGLKGYKEFYSRKKELFHKFIRELISSHAISREVLFYANELGISSGYLNEVCNEVSNRSAKEIIDSAVAARLKYELSYTSKSIQEIADEYNFPSQSYFSRYYKRLTGFTPSDFRKSRLN